MRGPTVMLAVYQRVVRVTAVVLPIVALVLLAVALLRPERAVVEHFDLPPLDSEISFDNAREASAVRSRLRQYVFGTAQLPRGLPAVARDVPGPRFATRLPNLARVDRLTVRMSLGFEAVVFHAIPRRGNGGLVVYHSGHDHRVNAGESTIAYFLARGYAVLVHTMPLYGPNTAPTTVATRCGRIVVQNAGDYRHHDRFACLPHAFRYFVEPVVVALNHTARLGYRLTAMAGLSGGGWTTVVYSALDPRVRRSYPVAGSQPHHVTARLCPDDDPVSLTRCFSDFEQRDPGFYEIANYVELYVLGGWGRGRKQLAVHNVYDSCCFGGRYHREWTPPVQAALRTLGSGAFETIGDTTHRKHAISRFALRVIERDLRGALRTGGR